MIEPTLVHENGPPGRRIIWLGHRAGGWSWFTDPLTLEKVRLIPRGMMPSIHPAHNYGWATVQEV